MKKGLLFLLLAGVLFADDIELKIQEIIPQTKIAGVKQATNDIYAVCPDSKNINLFYVKPDEKLLFFGEIWQNIGTNLSENLANWCNGLVKNSPVAFDDKVTTLKKNGLEITNGKGSQNGIEFIIFKSATCPHCMDLDNFLSKTNTTTYNYMAPSIESENYYKKYTKNPKDLLEKQLETVVNLNLDINSVPLTLVTKDSKVIEVIEGADLKKIRKYLY